MLQKCDNVPFITIEEGDMFGIMDLIPADKTVNLDREVKRQFCVMAADYSELLSLSMEVRILDILCKSNAWPCFCVLPQDMAKIKKNYPSIMEEMFNVALQRMNKMIKMRKEALDFYSNMKDMQKGEMVYGPNALLANEEEKVSRVFT